MVTVIITPDATAYRGSAILFSIPHIFYISHRYYGYILVGYRYIFSGYLVPKVALVIEGSI